MYGKVSLSIYIYTYISTIYIYIYIYIRSFDVRVCVFGVWGLGFRVWGLGFGVYIYIYICISLSLCIYIYIYTYDSNRINEISMYIIDMCVSAFWQPLCVHLCGSPNNRCSHMGGNGLD